MPVDVAEVVVPYCATTCRLDNEAKGSTQNRDLRSHTIEPKCEARRFYMASRVSMEHRSHWPSCLTDLEYSNRCYAGDVFCFANKKRRQLGLCMPHLGMFC